MKQTKHLKIWGNCTKQDEEQMQRLRRKLAQHGQGTATKEQLVWVVQSKQKVNQQQRKSESERRGLADILGHGQKLRVGAKCDGRPWKCLSSRVM